MNIVMLSGYATDVPKRETAKNGASRTELTIAVKDTQGHTEFITCIAWRELADRVKEHVIKGTYVEVQGHIKVNKSSRNKGGFVHIIADNVRFVYTPEESRKRHEQEQKRKLEQQAEQRQERPVPQQRVEQRQERPTPQQRVEQRQERPTPQQRVEQRQERPVVKKPEQQKNRVIMKKEPEVRKVENNQRTFEVDFSDVSEDDLPF